MKLGTVIGRVTLNKTVPALTGARWLIVSPFTREHYQRGLDTPPSLTRARWSHTYDTSLRTMSLRTSLAGRAGHGSDWDEQEDRGPKRVGGS